MSISIYSTAKRRSAVDATEQAAVSAIVSRYSVDDKIERLLATGQGLNWESFYLTLNAESAGLFRKATVFSGSTKLPDNEEDALRIGLQHWCTCLSEIRAALRGCDWNVAVEDHALH